MEQSELSELKVIARLVEGNREVTTLEKCFGLLEIDDEKKDASIPTKTIDETISEFLKEIEGKALESGRIVSKNEFARITVSIILFLVKQSEPELKLDVTVEKQVSEEKEDVNPKSDT